MWIVKIALGRPYTFVVLALLIALIGPLTILRMPTDIFPNIDIPVISVVWSYTGLAPEDMAERIVTPFERSLPNIVTDVEHTESQSLNGISVTKIFFQQGADVDVALAQVTAVAQSQLRQLPSGTTPPLILRYDASTVPVIQLALSGQSISEQQLFDLAQNTLRLQLSSVRGAGLPYTYGGKQRQVQVDLDQRAMQAYGLTPQDVNAAIGAQNLILPAGTEKIGQYEYHIKLNASPQEVNDFNNLPIKDVNGRLIYIRDVAHVRDGFAPQTNIVRVDGERAALITAEKIGNASTLDIINGIKRRMPGIRASVPSDLDIKMIGDQSIFVDAAVEGVLREGAIAAALTGMMILLFLGSWRSTLIITLSIPLSILSSVIVLGALGETINIMTLGGLALAVGILVDDATVAIENIDYQLEQGKEVEEAILDGAQQIAVPALVSTLCICIVFVPMFLLSGVARYLFVPLAESVVFAMLASYVLSRTLVPTMAKYLIKAHKKDEHGNRHAPASWLGRVQQGFTDRFEALRNRYHKILEGALERRIRIACGFLFVAILSFGLLPFLGQDFFPTVDGGQLKLHIRAATGTRIEETARLCDEIEASIRRILPPGDIVTIVDNIGIPVSGINLSYSNSAPIGPSDADIMITLSDDHQPIDQDMRELRRDLSHQFPGTTFAFLPADMVGQILNFGAPAPIDIQVAGRDMAAAQKYAKSILPRLSHVIGMSDLRIQQADDYPQFNVDVDRSRAEELGLSQSAIASNLLISLSGSFQTSPSFWLDAKNGVSYQVVTQTPQYRLDSLEGLRNTPVGGSNGQSRILGGLATIKRGVGPGVVSHYDVMPLVDIYATTDGRDLGAISSDIQQILTDTRQDLPRAMHVNLRGQTETMRQSFSGLEFGLIFSIVLVYLLIVVNFQSWIDPMIVISALPVSLAGIIWMLFVTRTTISVPALTGAIMSVGVATANSILVVSFARERLDAGADSVTAALEAGFTRFRPVLMTALAMIIGMIPMALGFGEGGEQNAPLGRAVIGGLVFANAATLFFVPSAFALIHSRDKRKPKPEPDRDDTKPEPDRDDTSPAHDHRAEEA